MYTITERMKTGLVSWGRGSRKKKKKALVI